MDYPSLMTTCKAGGWQAEISTEEGKWKENSPIAISVSFIRNVAAHSRTFYNSRRIFLLIQCEVRLALTMVFHGQLSKILKTLECMNSQPVRNTAAISETQDHNGKRRQTLVYMMFNITLMLCLYLEIFPESITWCCGSDIQKHFMYDKKCIKFSQRIWKH